MLITHQMDVIKQVCDRVAVLDAGRVVEAGQGDRRVHRNRITKSRARLIGDVIAQRTADAMKARVASA